MMEQFVNQRLNNNGAMNDEQPMLCGKPMKMLKYCKNACCDTNLFSFTSSSHLISMISLESLTSLKRKWQRRRRRRWKWVQPWGRPCFQKLQSHVTALLPSKSDSLDICISRGGLGFLFTCYPRPGVGGFTNGNIGGGGGGADIIPSICSIILSQYAWYEVNVHMRSWDIFKES